MLEQLRPSRLLGVACYEQKNKVCFLCSPSSSPLFSYFTHSLEYKEFYAARRPQLPYIPLFFIFGYFFILFLLYFFLIIQRSQQKIFGNVVVVGTGVFIRPQPQCVIVVLFIIYYIIVVMMYY